MLAHLLYHLLHYGVQFLYGNLKCQKGEGCNTKNVQHSFVHCVCQSSGDEGYLHGLAEVQLWVVLVEWCCQKCSVSNILYTEILYALPPLHSLSFCMDRNEPPTTSYSLATCAHALNKVVKVTSFYDRALVWELWQSRQLDFFSWWSRGNIRNLRHYWWDSLVWTIPECVTFVTGPMKRALNAAIEKGQNMRVVLTAWIFN